MLCSSKFLVVATFAWLACCTNSLWSQADPRLLNVEQFIHDGDCETKDEFEIAGQIISFCKEERDRLRSLDKRGLLHPSDVDRLQLLTVALSPIYESEHPYQTAEKMGSDLMDVVLDVYVVVGQEKISEHAIGIAVRRIEARALEKARLRRAPECTFIYQELIESLNFTDEQKGDFESLLKEIETDLSQTNAEEFIRQERLLDDHWNSLLLTLGPSKRDSAKALLRQPVQWFKDFGNVKSKIRDIKSGIHNSVPGPLLKFRADDGRGIFQMSPDEIRSHRIEFIHSHLQIMFQDQLLWDELDFSVEERERYSTGFETISNSGYHDQRLSRLLSGEVNFAKSIKDGLTERQLERLPSIEIQYLTSESESSVGLLNSKISEFLKLDSNERGAIRELARRYEKERSESMNGILQDREQIIVKFKLKFGNLLNDKQRHRFKKIQKHLSNSFAINFVFAIA